MSNNTPTQKDAARIEKAWAKYNGGQTQKGSFPSRIKSIADANAAKSK